MLSLNVPKSLEEANISGEFREGIMTEEGDEIGGQKKREGDPYRGEGSWRLSLGVKWRRWIAVEWCGIMGEHPGSEARLPGLDSQPHSSPTVWLWALCVSLSSFVK